MADATHEVYHDLVLGENVFMNKVYGWMATGLSVTALVAYNVAETPALWRWLITSNMAFLLLLAKIGVAEWLRGKAPSMDKFTAGALFVTYCALTGVSLAPLAIVYARASLTAAFVSTACVFVCMSLYGYVTKRSLASTGALAVTGLWGVLLAVFVNIFLGSPEINVFLSIACVVIFTALIGYDTQKLKELSRQARLAVGASDDGFAVVGALVLYLDFVNLFVHLLKLLGKHRDDEERRERNKRR